MVCPTCGKALVRSQRQGSLKSCPGCSRRRGRHVFYDDDSFGWRTPSATGVTIIQSHCKACRSGSTAGMTAAALC